MPSSVSFTYSLIENSTPDSALQRRYTGQNSENLRLHPPSPLRLGYEMAGISVPIPVTPRAPRSGLLPPPSQHASRVGTPFDSLASPIPRFNTTNPYATLADELPGHIGSHININDPLFDPIQVAIRTGEADNQAILTLCLLLMQENKQTHTALSAMNAKLDAISAVQAVHTANLTTFAQVNAANPPAIPSATRPANPRQKTPAGPSACQLYSAAAKNPAPPGPPAPPPTKKAKRKASETRPPPIDYSSMNVQQLFFSMIER